MAKQGFAPRQRAPKVGAKAIIRTSREDFRKNKRTAGKTGGR